MTEITSGIRSVLSVPAIYELWSRVVGGERARTTLIAEHARPGPTARILDLGCGPGELLSLMPPGVSYVGLDISEPYIARARRRFGHRAQFAVDDATSFDPAGRQFDLALAAGVLHHLDDHQVRSVFAAAAASLTSDGRFVTVDPVFVPDQSRAAREIISRDRGQHVRTPEGYARLAQQSFGTVDVIVRHDLLRMPYTHCIMECRAPSGRTA